MNRAIEILISAVIVGSLTLYVSRTIKLAAKYERKPRELSDWNALDQGIDPTQDSEAKQ